MSDITVTIQTSSDIGLHANADKLEIAKILGTQTIVPKGQYKIGDAVGRPLSNQAWQIASGRAKGGISGDRKRFANEEWLSLVN